MGVKKSLLDEADGGPLAIELSRANTHNSQLLEITLEAIVIDRPPRPTKRPSICAWTRRMILRPAIESPRKRALYRTFSTLAKRENAFDPALDCRADAGLVIALSSFDMRIRNYKPLLSPAN